MIRISYDHQIFGIQTHGGISRYFVELAQQLSLLSGFEATIMAPLHINEYVNEADLEVYGFKIKPISYTAKFRRLLNDTASEALLRLTHPTVIHETFFSSERIGPKHIPRVLTIYDMIHEKFPHNFSADDHLSASKKIAAARADKVICISDSTRKDLIDILDIPANKVVTIPLGFAPFKPKNNAGKKKSLTEKPYILYVGQRKGYKNFSGLVEAYASSPILRRDFQLHAFGGGRFTAEDELLFTKNDLKIGQNVFHFGGSDADLSHAYANAAVFVYPSLYEGFGIPPLEAMSEHCPVIASNASSVPEVVGNAAITVDTRDVDELAASIEKVLLDSELQKKMIAMGLERCKQFTWEKCAEKTSIIYKDLAT